MNRWILFQGDKFILTEGGAIATEAQYVNGTLCYAHMKNGVIKRLGDVIGSQDDITVLGPADDVEIDIASALCNLLSGEGWPWEGLQ